jgi:hypothetical protein
MNRIEAVPSVNGHAPDATKKPKKRKKPRTKPATLKPSAASRISPQKRYEPFRSAPRGWQATLNSTDWCGEHGAALLGATGR